MGVDSWRLLVRLNLGPDPSELSAELAVEEEGKKMQLTSISVNETWANGETLEEQGQPGHHASNLGRNTES